MFRFRVLSGDRGSTTVLVALSLPVLLGVQVLTVDLGRAFVEAGRVQAAADAAALAAVDYLPISTTSDEVSATAAAKRVADDNGGLVAEEDIVFPTSQQVSVTARATVPFWFGPLLGFTGVDVQRTAVAQVGIVTTVLPGNGASVQPALGVVPLGVEYPAGGFVWGRPYCLYVSSEVGCGTSTRLLYHPLKIDPYGATDFGAYGTRVRYGAVNPVTVGETRSQMALSVMGSTINNQTNSALNSRISTYTTASATALSTNAYHVSAWSRTRRLLILPVMSPWDGVALSGTVAGFAVFIRDSHNSSGVVVGRFVPVAIPGQPFPTDETPGTTPDYGARAVRLVQ